MIGWIKLHRKVLYSDMYKSLNSKQRDVMMTCLILANHSENEWEYSGAIYKCKAGQFVSSLQKIANFCGSDVKVQSVRTALLKLEKWGFLTNESTNQNRLITICKWDTYQQIKDDTNKDGNNHLTSDQQTPNKRLTTNKNEDKEKKENNSRAFVADVNRDHVHYRKYLWDIVKEKEISRDKLFLKCKIDVSMRNELWEDFISNSSIYVSQIDDDEHAWNTFKKFVIDNSEKYKIGKRLTGTETFEGFG